MQAHRLKRTRLSFAFYSLCALIIGFSAWQGLYPLEPLLIYCAAYVVVCAVFILIIRKGWNLRFSEPSLTRAQFAASAVLCSYACAYAGQLRGVFLLAYTIGLMFGGTALSVRQLAGLAMVPLILFPLSGMLADRLYAPIDWRVEFVNWVSLCVILSFTVMLIGHLVRLRMRLRTANAELQAALERITDMAVHDELTGLYNRRHLLDMLDREKRLAERCEDRFCVAILDIDFFKRINDTYGHGEGDAVLRTFARVAKRHIRATDLLCRWGGEEFLMLLPHTAMEEVESCLQRIRAELARTTLERLDAHVRISFSAGIAQNQPGKSIDELIERADRALYAAKNAGRNRIFMDGGDVPARELGQPY